MYSDERLYFFQRFFRNGISRGRSILRCAGIESAYNDRFLYGKKKKQFFFSPSWKGFGR